MQGRGRLPSTKPVDRDPNCLGQSRRVEAAVGATFPSALTNRTWAEQASAGALLSRAAGCAGRRVWTLGEGRPCRPGPRGEAGHFAAPRYILPVVPDALASAGRRASFLLCAPASRDEKAFAGGGLDCCCKKGAAPGGSRLP